jgi:phosphatidylinositol-3-phosphatase
VANRASNEEGRAAGRCPECGAACSTGQRYCLECGARRGPLPAIVARRVAALKDEARAPGAVAAGAAAAEAAAATAAEAAVEEKDAWRFMPSPQVAAVAVMALLAAGVILGSVTSPLAQSAATTPVLLEIAEANGSPPPPEPSSEAAAVPAPAAVPATVAPEPLAPAAEAPAPEAEPTGPVELPPELEEEEGLPEIEHVFLIVLTEHGFEEAFGKASPAPYLARELAGKGELLSNYYAVSQGGLANEIALLSGQGPTPETAVDCPNYTDIAPGTVGTLAEQVEGNGCVYPPATQTLPGQLAAAKLSWKGYVEDIAAGAPEGSATCRHPVLGGPDANQAPLPGSPFLSWRNPFVYFHSLLDSPECATADIGLEQLSPDLSKANTTPNFSYIVPDACHDGSEAPCEPGAVAGLAGAEAFLKTVVPEIEASPAYEEGGLIAITFDRAPQAGPAADSSSCCATPAYPNLPPPPESTATGPVEETGGGGRVGLLLLSKYVAPGTVNESGYYNHFSLLLSLEELFGRQPLGYAAEPTVTGFDSSVYNAEEAGEGSTTESTAAAGSSVRPAPAGARSPAGRRR